MHQIKVDNLIKILKESELEIEELFSLTVNPAYVKGKGEEILHETLQLIGGNVKHLPLLEHLKFDFKIKRNLFVYDDQVHFNRYRLSTFKSSLYESFSYNWIEGYKRMCRTFEKECLKSGLQSRVWEGPPIASRLFGKAEEAGDLSGNGSSGWKLNAYNDAQYDLVSRLHGYKLIRIPLYENLMIGGSLKKIDDLLLNPKEASFQAIHNWLIRKMDN